MYRLNPFLQGFWKTPADIKVLYGGRASSKCLAIGTKVMMFDGTLRAVEDVCVGDQVMGPDSKPRNVLHTTTGHSPMYRVKQCRATDYVVNEDHILSVRRVEASRKGKMLANKTWSPRYPHLGDVANVNVREYMNSSNKFKVNFVGYKAGLIQFDDQDVALDPYIFGLWLGDGHRDAALFTTMDREIVDALKEFASANDMLFEFVSNNGGKASTYRIREKDRRAKRVKGTKRNRIITALRNYGVFSDLVREDGKRIRKRVDKRIPHAYIQNSKEKRLQLLAGIIDTDGTCINENCYVITSSCEAFAEDLKLLVDTLGFRSSINERSTTAQNGFKGTAWAVTFSGKTTEIPCRLPRKKSKKNGRSDETLTYIDVEPIGMGDYAGFSVDGDHLFCLADGTVTHNSHDAAGFAVYLAANYTLRFMCARQFQNKISESVYVLLKNKIEDSPYRDDFDIQKNTIINRRTGSVFFFYGIARNLQEIKSAEDIDILWLEEAQYLTKEQWETIEPTIRKAHSQIWMIFNPDELLDFVYETFITNTPENCIAWQINYNNNPFLSAKALGMIELAYKTDPRSAEHIYGGKPKMGQDKSVIPILYVMAALNAHKRYNAKEMLKPEKERQLWLEVGQKVIGFDIADDGDDLCANITVHGNIANDADEWHGLEDELLKSSTRTYNKALEIGADIVFDSIGVGANAGPKFKENNEARNLSITYEAFNAGAGVEDPDKVFLALPHAVIKNKDQFANIKAQKWWEVAERFRKTYEVIELGVNHPIDQLLSIDAEKFPPELLKKLQRELSSPRKDTDGHGRFKVESKVDLKKRGINSPNLADAFIMAYIKPKRKAATFF